MQPGLKRQQTTVTVERLNGGRLRLEKRNNSPYLYAAAYLQGRNRAKSTGETNVNAARKVAFDWYVSKIDQIRRGERLTAPSFADSVKAFLTHSDLVQEVSVGQRRNYRQKWSVLKKYFEGVNLPDIDARFLLELRNARVADSSTLDTDAKSVRGITNATLQKDMDFVRLVLRHAMEFEKIISSVPQFPSFRGKSWTVLPSRRPFLDYAEWKTVRSVASDRAKAPGLNPRTQRQREELYCFILMCVGGALRVEEAYSLRWMDCTLVTLDDKDRTESVALKVFGKHSIANGVREDGYALYDGVIGYKLLKSLRPDALPTDKLFLEKHRDGMRELLVAAGLRENVDGISRDSKSLRQTGISMRLELGPSPDYRDIAKWARTSVTQISQFYDQTHPRSSVERVTGFRDLVKRVPQNEKEAEQMAKSERDLEKLRSGMQRANSSMSALEEFELEQSERADEDTSG